MAKDSSVSYRSTTPRQRHPRETEPLEAASVYLHVGNSGVTFSVLDAGYGPTIQVQSSAFGNLNLDFRAATDRDGLIAVRDMLNKALERDDYSQTYVHAAEHRGAGTYSGSSEGEGSVGEDNGHGP